jgi:dTDP-4-dehydrorhamnose 3,5-epimerase
MIFRELTLKGAYSIELEPHGDERGQFVRTWCRDEFARHGLEVTFVQTAVSINRQRGTLRGLHWQEAPHAEAKLIRCARGAIYDVIVDIRQDSPTFGRWIGLTLTPQSQLALFVPQGFAHGFQSLEDDSEVSYQLSAAHAPASARGLRFDDPALAIDWPLPVSRISDWDRSWPLLDAKDGRPAGTDVSPGLSPAGSAPGGMTRPLTRP